MPKAFVTVLGRTLIDHALDTVRRVPRITHTVVVVPADRINDAWPDDVIVVPGGKSRQASVFHGISALPTDIDVICVHDVARALTPPALYERAIDATTPETPVVVPVLPVADTIRQLDGTIIDRSDLRSVQTPQIFMAAVLREAHDVPAYARDDEKIAATDDAGLAQQRGYSVTFVPGDDHAFKITTPFDLSVAQAVASEGTMKV